MGKAVVYMIVFLGAVLVAFIMFRDDFEYYARQMGYMKGASYGYSGGSGTGMGKFGNSLGNTFKSFGEGIK